MIGGNYAVDVIKLNQDDATHEGNITLHGIGSTAANGAGSGAATIGNAATNLLDLTGAFHTGGDTIYEAKTGGTYIDFSNAGSAITSTVMTGASAGHDITFKTSEIKLSDGTSLTVHSGSGDTTLTNIHGVVTNATSDLTVNGATVKAYEIGLSTAPKQINKVEITGSTKVELNGAIYTGGTSGDNSVTITGPIDLKEHITIDTTQADGAITLDGTVDGAKNLDIISGTALAKITGNIGTGTALNSLDINAVDTSGDTGGVTLEGNIGVGVASGTTPGVTTTTNLGNQYTNNAITLSGVSYNVDGALTLESGHSYVVNGTDTNGTTIVTDGDAVTFGSSNNAADLTIGEKPFKIDTDTTAGSGGNIVFFGDIIGASGTTAADVTLDAYDATVTVLGIGHNGTSDNLSLIHI